MLRELCDYAHSQLSASEKRPTQPCGSAAGGDRQTRMDTTVSGRLSSRVAGAELALQAGGHRFDPSTLHLYKCLQRHSFRSAVKAERGRSRSALSSPPPLTCNGCAPSSVAGPEFS